jgi:D-galactarolactone cycloisomerase
MPARASGRVLEEVKYSLDKGHRAFKIKVGRGFKWMEKTAGLKRDIEVVRTIRREVVPDVKLMVDSNNGYDLVTTKRFLEAVDDDLFFVEEMFPETVEECLELRRWLRERGWKTLVADGESARKVSHFDPFIEANAIDVLQGDIRTLGFTRQLTLSRKISTKNMLLAPHNWGSYIALHMQAVLARGIPNFCIAEQDPTETDLFAGAELFKLEDGLVSVPDTPGCGLELRVEEARKRFKPDWQVS